MTMLISQNILSLKHLLLSVVEHEGDRISFESEFLYRAGRQPIHVGKCVHIVVCQGQASDLWCLW